jgi:magnesium-transporting ATPase (P-type)
MLPMPTSDPSGPQVLSSSRGRLRVHLPGWSGAAAGALEARLRQAPGVRAAEANPLTRNALLTFDPDRTSADALVGHLRAVCPDPPPPAPEVEVLSSSPGRLRVRLPGWSGAGGRWLEHHLRRAPGARHARASRLTGTLLVLFDPVATTAAALLGLLRSLRRQPPPVPAGARGPSEQRRARIVVRGLEREPKLAHRVIQHLHARHGIRAHLKALTGHLHVEYDHGRVLLEEILAEVAHMALPELPGEDRPEHPLDPEPLAQGLVRVIGSVLGVGYATVRQLATGGAPGNGVAGFFAGLFNLAQGFPFVRDGLRGLLGRHAADAVSTGLAVVALALADFPLGLITALSEGLLFLGEVTSRRAAWRRYEDRLDAAASAEPGAVLRLEAGMRLPHRARVVEGRGSATGHDGLPLPLAPGCTAPAGAVLSGGPFVFELEGGPAFEPTPRPAPPSASVYDRYLRLMAPLSLAYSAFTLLRTASPGRAFEALLLLNPRTAVIAREAADLAAAARALRAGLTVIGTRPHRRLRRPDVLLLDGPRLLTDGLEIAGTHPFGEPALPSDLLDLAAVIDAAAGSPWGKVFPPPPAGSRAVDGYFNGLWAAAEVDGVRYVLGPPEDVPLLAEAFADEHEGGYLLDVRTEEDGVSLGFVALRPRLSAGAAELFAACRRLGVKTRLLDAGAPYTAHAVARRAGVDLAAQADPVRAVHAEQLTGAVVALVSDHAEAAAGFAACDLAVGLAGGRGDFPARADVLAPDLRALIDLLEAGTRRDAAVRDGVMLAAAANAAGAVLGFNASLGHEGATALVYLSALTALADGWLRLRGGSRPGSSLAHLADPRPERWGRRALAEVLDAFNTQPEGLTSVEAAARRVPPPAGVGGDELLSALRRQVGAPVTALLAGGACVTLLLGQPLNTAILGTTIALNVGVGVWQERQVGRAAEALERLGAPTARVLRDGALVAVPAPELVPGDVLVLTPGDRVAADARVLEAAGLEVDEASLTGESLPVVKAPDADGEGGRVVLEGSDVAVGTGRAVVVAVGRQTRLGATAAALALERDEDSPLGARLGRILRIAVPVAAGGGVLAGLAGLLYGGAPLNMLTLGVTTFLSAIPEGLPLLAGVGQAAVARRLAKHGAVVRRIAAVEALGRVDVACTDKTGTLTEGRLALRLLLDAEGQAAVPGPLTDGQRRLLLTAARASPHPDAANAGTHPTDAAVVRAALAVGLGEGLRAERSAEVPFDAARAFYASVVGDRLCVKGAPERLLPRCASVWAGEEAVPLDEGSRAALLDRVAVLAGRGLRVLLAAEGPAGAAPNDPQGLTALGLLGISDPLRPTVRGAVRRCLLAGVRVIVLTGDHPLTARAIAEEAGLLVPGHDAVVRAADLAGLTLPDLGRRLEGVAVIARATPVDKLRVIESLRLRGHTVAMTGDGVNDAPSLRLADVGVAMGRSGTEVARQAADVVLADDDFASLVEALVEGRGFWRNMRSALGLLLGGNLGELGLVVGGNVLGTGSPLTTVEILIVNLITDLLPVLAVVLQQPQHRDLAGLAREGLSAVDEGLRRDVLRRAVATALPSLAGYLFEHAGTGPAQARAVAFTGVVATQLAQTLDAGRVGGTFSRSVSEAVGGSAALLLASVTVPPLRDFLGLLTPSPLGWGLVGAGSVAAVLINRAIARLEGGSLGGRRPAKIEGAARGS